MKCNVAKREWDYILLRILCLFTIVISQDMRKIEYEKNTWTKISTWYLHVIACKNEFVVAREWEPTFPINPKISTSATQKQKRMEVW